MIKKTTWNKFPLFPLTWTKNIITHKQWKFSSAKFKQHKNLASFLPEGSNISFFKLPLSKTDNPNNWFGDNCKLTKENKGWKSKILSPNIFSEWLEQILSLNIFF